MIKEFRKHLSHYLVLLGILVFGFLGFTGFSYDKAFQMAIIVAVAVSFVAWGLVHHYIHEDLNLKIVLEYIAMAILGAAILASLV